MGKRRRRKRQKSIKRRAKRQKSLQRRVKKQRRRKRKMMTKKIKTNLVKNETEAVRGIVAPVDAIVARRSHAAAQRAAVETDLVEIAEIMGGVAEATPEIQIAATVEGEIAIVEDAVTGDLIEAVSEAMRLQLVGDSRVVEDALPTALAKVFRVISNGMLRNDLATNSKSL